MHSKFSPELIAKMKRAYKNRTGIDIDDDFADMILEHFGAYGEIVLNIIRDKKAKEKQAL